MPNQPILVRYHGATKNFGPLAESKRVEVKPGDVLTFSLLPATRVQVPGSKLRITITSNQSHFNPPTIAHTLTQIGSEPLSIEVVTALPPGSTFYDCELLQSDPSLEPIAKVEGETGGEIVPDSGGS